MSIGDELDKLAAEGRLTSITLARRHGGGWQGYLKLGQVDSYVAQVGDTPSAALSKAMEKLPSCEAYDLKFGTQAVTDRAKAERQEVEQAGSWADFAAAETRAVAIGLEPIEPAGIFD